MENFKEPLQPNQLSGIGGKASDAAFGGDLASDHPNMPLSASDRSALDSPRDEIFVGEASAGGSELSIPEVISADDIVAGAFNALSSAIERYRGYTASAAAYRQRAQEWLDKAVGEESAASAAAADRALALPAGRRALWEVIPKTEKGYATDINGLRHAVCLSFPMNAIEEPAVRGARADTIVRMGAAIRQGAPAVVCARSTGREIIDYCAGTPQHDGFSFALNKDNVYRIGINEQTRIPLSRLQDTDRRSDEVGGRVFDLGLEIRSGEAAANFITQACRVHIESIVLLEARTRTPEDMVDAAHARNLLRDGVHNLANAVLAARDIGITLDLGSEHENKTLRNILYLYGEYRPIYASGTASCEEVLKYLQSKGR